VCWFRKGKGKREKGKGKREKEREKGGRDGVEARQGITHTLAHAHAHGI